MKKRDFLLSLLNLIPGLGLGFIMGIVFCDYYQRTITVRIYRDNDGILNTWFKSDGNHEGDKFYIIMSRDTVNSGEVVNSEWEDIKK